MCKCISFTIGITVSYTHLARRTLLGKSYDMDTSGTMLPGKCNIGPFSTNIARAIVINIMAASLLFIFIYMQNNPDMSNIYIFINAYLFPGNIIHTRRLSHAHFKQQVNLFSIVTSNNEVVIYLVM